MESQPRNYTALTQNELSKVRKSIDPIAYKHSMTITFLWFFVDLAFYVLCMYGIFATQSITLKIIFGILAGIATSSMFVWAHDAAHGSLFKNRILSEILGTLFMLPSLNMYKLWSYGHNRIHHGFNSYSSLDWIWRPLTISEYRNLNKYRRILYRVERSLYGCGLHYIYKVWWPKMVRFMPIDFTFKKKLGMIMNKMVTLLFAVIISIIFYSHGGLFSVFVGLVIPFIVFNYVISLVVYLHHTHPDIPFFDERNEWNFTIGALYCTTVIRTNWLIEKITHDILIHTPHHVDVRIPFYRLKPAFIGIKTHYSQYLHEYKLDIATLKNIFKTCKLYDYKNHIWYNFNQIKIAY
ncbi:MAG: fatty acid desaturase [Burkholderiales bacterium]|nr:fatty acid desaturase [Burkholderiales bacterium]